ncbi:MAG: DUF4405 domain-containing protein [Deltaproteobacteria bacterium]|nr:DUF4405 domain-containing protein [Deltaproteobacteria bacterium]
MMLVLIAGWITIFFVFLALLNFLLKQVSREYVKRLPKEYKDFADAYRRFMQRIIRGHRYFGIAALSVFLLHAGLILFFYDVISITGMVTGIVLFATVSMGAYGYFINKDFRSWWVSVHRGCAFALLVSALVHLFYKLYI